MHVAETALDNGVHGWRVRGEFPPFPVAALTLLRRCEKTPAARLKTARRGEQARFPQVWVLSLCHFQQLVRPSASNIGLLW